MKNQMKCLCLSIFGFCQFACVFIGLCQNLGYFFFYMHTYFDSIRQVFTDPRRWKLESKISRNSAKLAVFFHTIC